MISAMNYLCFKISLSLVFQYTVAQINLKYECHYINNYACSFFVKALTSVRTVALYLSDLNVPFARGGWCFAGYNVELYLGIVWVEVHIHCNKLSLFECSYPYKVQIK
jgi:hypothetical protein